MHDSTAQEQSMIETATASGMGQGESGVAGDPLDLTGAVGTDDDVLPGPPGGAEPGEATAEDTPTGDSGTAGDADPAPESVATLDPPRTNPDADAVSDP